VPSPDDPQGSTEFGWYRPMPLVRRDRQRGGLTALRQRIRHFAFSRSELLTRCLREIGAAWRR